MLCWAPWADATAPSLPSKAQVLGQAPGRRGSRSPRVVGPVTRELTGDCVVQQGPADGGGVGRGDRVVGQLCSEGFFRGVQEAASVKQSQSPVSSLPGPPQRSRASMASWWALATWRWVAHLLSLSFPEHPVASLRWVLSVAGGRPRCLPHVLGLWRTFPVTVGFANRKWWRQSRLRGREAGPAAEAQGGLGMGSPTGGRGGWARAPAPPHSQMRPGLHA